MAVTSIETCPHCRAESMTFTFLASYPIYHDNFSAAFSCNGCGYLIGKKMRGRREILGQGTGRITDFEGDLSVSQTYPALGKLRAPADIPANAERVFLQAVDASARGHYDAAGSMYRKAIEIGTRALDEELAGKKLQSRIDALHNAGRLTSDLKDWAHLIRIDGNESVHEDEALTESEIRQLGTFTELFLTYTFTLPARVAARKKEAEQAAAKSKGT